MAFAGELEIHLTVYSDMPGSDTLRDYAAMWGWKYLHIVLARGETPSQPMLTSHLSGDLATARQTAEETAQALQSDGFTVTRIKIEAAPWNDDIPQGDSESLSRERHFEHHVKLCLPEDADVNQLAAVAIRHGAHLSRNALKQRTDGYTERFVTQRCFDVGRGTAKRRLDSLLADLAPLGYPILDQEEEYVVYDSNLSLDNGWLDGKKEMVKCEETIRTTTPKPI